MNNENEERDKPDISDLARSMMDLEYQYSFAVQEEFDFQTECLRRVNTDPCLLVNGILDTLINYIYSTFKGIETDYSEGDPYPKIKLGFLELLGYKQ